MECICALMSRSVCACESKMHVDVQYSINDPVAQGKHIYLFRIAEENRMDEESES